MPLPATHGIPALGYFPLSLFPKDMCQGFGYNMEFPPPEEGRRLRPTGSLMS